MSEQARRCVIKRLKSQAKDHYYKSQANQDMNCGGWLGDYIRCNHAEDHYFAFRNCLARLRRIDPTCPSVKRQPS